MAGIVAAALLACTFACGGPTMSPSDTPISGTTITITSNGVNPMNLLVKVGAQVTFINNDVRSHDMEDDPHPGHGDCPALESVGFLRPGERRQTGNLNIVGTCGYHDHDDFPNPKWLGKITIQ